MFPFNIPGGGYVASTVATDPFLFALSALIVLGVLAAIALPFALVARSRRRKNVLSLGPTQRSMHLDPSSESRAAALQAERDWAK